MENVVTTDNIVGAALFAMAVLHTFMVGKFQKFGNRFEEGSVLENVFHFLGEVEAVFLIWAAILFCYMIGAHGWHHATHYIEGLNYTEPAFVFVIMVMAATRPILVMAEGAIRRVATVLVKSFGIDLNVAFFWVALIIGPLLGSFITEPAAMTVTALILFANFYQKPRASKLFKYSTMGTLFVSVSVGGTLTHFAAPPVVMVAGKWGWDISHMLGVFGWKAAVAVIINATLLTIMLKRELTHFGETMPEPEASGKKLMPVPIWVIALNVAMIGLVVASAHYMSVFLGIFLFFLGFCKVTGEFHESIKLKEGLLVGAFLAGLVTLGSMQSWWLQPLLSSLGDGPLFLGATGLTAVTDNAALTFLGSLVANLPETAKFALVAGAVAGGGLTVIANAPNPAGYGILSPAFGKDGIKPLGLLMAAIPPTLVAMACLWFLPSL